MKQAKALKHKITAVFGQKPPAVMHWGMMDFDAIPLAIGITDKGEICRVEFAAGKTKAGMLAEWKKAWPKTEFQHDPKAIAPQIKKITMGGALNLRVIGTEFQCEIWKNLLRIPMGEVITYAELARRSKRPKAVRAAGTACGANPICILVPCHRVLASNGGLGGFGGGLPTKKKLLKAEGFQQF